MSGGPREAWQRIAASVRRLWVGNKNVAYPADAGSDGVEAAFLEFVTANFDSRFYLKSNPDVAAAGVSPLTHWLEHGLQEGRLIAPHIVVRPGAASDRDPSENWRHFSWRGTPVMVKQVRRPEKFASFGGKIGMIAASVVGDLRNRLAPRIRYAICTIAKNEAPYLAEWIAYHLAVGFDHIFIYDNESTDDGTVMFATGRWKPYVTIVPWRSVGGVAPQHAAYQDFVKRNRNRVTWTAFIDVDEFINLKKHSSIAEFLSDYPGVHAVGINWRMFGSSHRRELEPGFVIDRFKRASEYSWSVNKHVKTIARTRYVKNADVHNPELVEGTTFVGPDHVTLNSGRNSRQTHASFDTAQINHYFTKSLQEYVKKMNRGRADVAPGLEMKFRTIAEFDHHDRNEEEDTTIQRWRKKMVLKLAELTGPPRPE